MWQAKPYIRLHTHTEREGEGWREGQRDRGREGVSQTGRCRGERSVYKCV